MSVLFVWVWSSRKWLRHFLSKHREMTPHSLTTWEHPKPNESSPWLRQIAIARGSWFDTELYLYCSRTSTKLVLCNNDLLVNLFLKFSYMGDNAHKTIALRKACEGVVSIKTITPKIIAAIFNPFFAFFLFSSVNTFSFSSLAISDLKEVSPI